MHHYRILYLKQFIPVLLHRLDPNVDITKFILKKKRRVVLNLTGEGKHHLEQTLAQTRTHIADLLESLTNEEIVHIEEGLTLLKHVFERSEVKKAP